MTGRMSVVVKNKVSRFCWFVFCAGNKRFRASVLEKKLRKGWKTYEKKMEGCWWACCFADNRCDDF